MSLQKLQDLTIYRDDRWYSTFPSVIRKADGGLICGFRRAPERRLQPGGGVSHIDPNSQAVCVTSSDEGLTWSPSPELVYAHPAAGCQDPCLHLLSDGTIVCTLFAWQLFPVKFAEATDLPHEVRMDHHGWPMGNLGVHVLRSTDGGATWSEPFLIPPPPGATDSLPGYPGRGAIRGRMVELPDGTLLMPIYGCRYPSPSYAYRSTDRGQTWEYFSTIAEDTKVDFHEPHLHLCPSGKIVAFLRTAGLDGYLALCHSLDGGKTWSEWQRSEVWGHPFTTAVAPDGRVLVAYGYRREPFGIRCLLTDPECERFDLSEELILRDDLGNHDIGYTWAVTLADGSILVAYYANIEDGTRFIAGSIVKVV